MRRRDVEALADLAGRGLAAGGAVIAAMHEGIASRPFGVLGRWATPVRVVHDGVTGAVYGKVRDGLHAAARGAGALAGGGAPADGPPLKGTPRGSVALGALNGLYGNHLDGSELAVSMGLRRRGRDVAATREALAGAYPDATSRLVVFVHGLGCDDQCWWLLPLAGGTQRRRSYGERLQDELSFTPLYVRYNTGLHISENGRALARLLDDLVAQWPLGVEELVLVGHSMGGLVARSACHYGDCGGRRWTFAVRHVFCLGSPHLGADLEKGVNALSWAFARVPETRAFATVLNSRSVGIKDLRYGSCVEEDWCDCDPDEFLHDRCTEVPFLAEANYYFVCAALRPAAVGSLVGDLLVRLPSASGRGNGKGRRIPFEVDNGYELSGLTHFGLLNHPAVYAQIRAWITRRPAQRGVIEATA